MRHFKGNNRAKGPWVANLRMSVHKVREKQHPVRQTALMIDLTAHSIRLNMKLRSYKMIFSCLSHYKPMKSVTLRTGPFLAAGE